MSNTTNEVTNELLLKYDEKFNEQYRKIVNVNSSIMNKEELILKENDEIINKDNSIKILQYTTILIIIYGICFVLYGNNRLSISQLIIYIIVLFIVYLLFIYFNIYYKLTAHALEKNLRNIRVKMTEYTDTIINDSEKYRCPSKCSPTGPSQVPGKLQGYQQPTLNIDPQVNVWKYGDIPVDLYTSNKIKGADFYTKDSNIPNYRNTAEEELVNEPKPFFGTTYPSSTYYKCKWLGGNNNGGLPNMESDTYSSIPCNFRQNFAEEGKYICNKNPNNLTPDDFKRSCNDMSSI